MKIDRHELLSQKKKLLTLVYYGRMRHDYPGASALYKQLSKVNKLLKGE